MLEKDSKQTKLPKAFWALIGAQVISLFGNAVLRFALPLYVLNLTGSAALMGMVIACSWIPYIALAPIGGVAADRVPKRIVMAVLDGIMALVCLCYLLFLQLFDVVTLSVVSLMILYAVQSVYQPTVQASVPALVIPDSIQKSNRPGKPGQYAFGHNWSCCRRTGLRICRDGARSHNFSYPVRFLGDFNIQCRSHTSYPFASNGNNSTNGYWRFKRGVHFSSKKPPSYF